MGADDLSLSSCRIKSGFYHLVGDGVGEKDHQVRTSDPAGKIRLILAEDLCPAPMLPAHILVVSFHTFISTDYHNTHYYLFPFYIMHDLESCRLPIVISYN